MKKSRQKSLGECPEPPDASVHPARKAKGRLPGAGLDDAYKVPQAHFYVEIVDRVPLPRSGGGGRGRGQMRPRLPLERICAQYGFRFFFPEKSKSVASAAKRQEGLSRGKPGPP